MSSPVFTVVLPTWNDAARLPRALDSVLGQTFTDFELVVVDDGSTDGTAEMLRRYRHRNTPTPEHRIQTIFQEHAGVSAARNRGLREARGRWILFLDSDDEALPHWLETLFPGTQEPDAGLICCGLQLVRPERGAVGASDILLPRSDDALFHHLPSLFLAGAFTVESQLMRGIGGYDPSLDYSENTDLGIRLVERCLAEGRRVTSVPQPLVRYHLGPETDRQQSRSLCRKRLASIRYFLDHHRRALARQPESLRSFVALGGVLAARLGDPVESRRFFRQGLRLAPWRWRNWMRYSVALVPALARRVWPAPIRP